eukprot:355434-Chlamydomonas_euryale.AAC.5
MEPPDLLAKVQSQLVLPRLSSHALRRASQASKRLLHDEQLKLNDLSRSSQKRLTCSLSGVGTAHRLEPLVAATPSHQHHLPRRHPFSPLFIFSFCGPCGGTGVALEWQLHCPYGLSSGSVLRCPHVVPHVAGSFDGSRQL